MRISKQASSAHTLSNLHYSSWINAVDALHQRDRSLILGQIATWENAPLFQIALVKSEGDCEALRQVTLDSLAVQLYRNFTIISADQDVGDSWVLILRHGDRLAEHALYWFACETLKQPDAAIIYSDDDELDGAGRRSRPRFKPDWSLAHLRSTDYIGNAVVLRGRAVEAAGGLRLDGCRHGLYDLLLRVVECADDGVAHIPAVLLHRVAPHSPALPAEGGRDLASWNEPQWCMQVLKAHLARNKVAGDVSETLLGCWRVRYKLPDAPPLVSIVVPIRDALHLTRQCVESLLEKTSYPHFEILVVDNQSSDAGTLAYLSEISNRPNVRVLRYDRPFNYSAINNFAVRAAQGEILCMLNNDTEVISPDWLEEMVGHLLQDRVGVVGCKLYYPDGRVQHAGDVVGPGRRAGHLHAFIGRDDPGYCNRAIVAQEFSSVTAACLITWRDLYLRLGGFDEKNLPVAYNDVDFCLRVRQAGHRVVWTPHAELYHHESVSRGKDKSLRRKIQAALEIRFMRRNWCEAMKNDPFYNPNFDYALLDFSLSHAPMLEKPWLI